MNPLHNIWRWLRSLGQRRAVKQEIDEELRFHLEQRTAENITAGMSQEDAEREARKRFGNVQSVREECRERRGASFGEATWQDVRFGLRMLRKNPGFTAVAVLTLALGIGANTAIFSVVNAVLLRPLPYHESERLVAVSESNPQLGWQQYTVSLANYLDWREQNSVFDALAATATAGMGIMNSASGPEQVRTAFVSANLFPVFNVKPLLGRSFVIEEEQRGHADVVLLSERLWRNRFGADSNIVNQSVRLNGRSFTVVGVMPARLKLFEPSRVQGWESGLAQADLWRPLVVWPEKLKWRNMREFLVLGRLKPGITLEEAQSQMTGIASRIEQQFPDSNRGWGARVTPWQQEVTGRSNTGLLMLLAAAALALLIATANLANLLLARLAARQREFAVRVALGAGRFRLTRQLLTESLLLGCAGGAAGLLLGHWGLSLLTNLLPATLPRAEEIGLDLRVLGFVVVVSVITSVTFGLWPILQFWRTDVNEALKRESLSNLRAGSGQVRSLLVISEVALVTMLLVGAGLMTRSFFRLSEVHLGFNPERLVSVDVSLGGWNYTNGSTMIEFVERLLPRLAELPGTQSTATGNLLPLDLARENLDIAFTVEGRPPQNPNERLVAGLRQASPAYFKTLGIPLARGRYFTDYDNRSTRSVAIVNESFTRQFFAGSEPIGQRISSPDFGSEPCEIVGVIKDVKHAGANLPATPEVFRPHLQSCFSTMTIVARTSLTPVETIAALRLAVAAIDRDVAVYNPRTMAQQVTAASAPQRFSMLLMGLLASLALALGIVGIYGVLSSIVGERTREIGVRMALGAQRRDIFISIIGRGMRMVMIGMGLGLVGALVLTRWLRSQLFEITPTDPLTFASVTLIVVAIAIIACWLPARRATKVAPMEALRHE
ncbi:MAG: ABC transporter permease [Verrucomicrobia bacterium]|nr:ABC transporter permease [Verrucomicrobiota bacterium]